MLLFSDIIQLTKLLYAPGAPKSASIVLLLYPSILFHLEVDKAKITTASAL